MADADPQTPEAMAKGALFTDVYQLTMAAAYVADGFAEKPATFSLFVRTLPASRGYLVAGGLDAALDFLEDYRFTDADLEALAAFDRFDDAFLDYLSDLRFEGTVRAVPEGRLVFADEPILEIDAPVGVAQLVETFLLNQVTTQTTLNTKAARMRHAAAGRAVLDFAARRCQGTEAAMKLTRADVIVGLAGTSNVAGAAAYGLPVSGTMAHSFVQAHPDETDAFRTFGNLFGADSVFLVDTYDTRRGVARALEVAEEMRAADGTEIRGIRLDSGDLETLARQARTMMDDAGFENVQIFASGGLDEHQIAELVASGAPIDGYGVGSALGVSSDAPVLNSVYKLVAFDGRDVRKTSTGKESWPGAKQVWRASDAAADVLATIGEEAPLPGASPLLTDVVRDGARTALAPTRSDLRSMLDDAREWFEHDWGALPDGVRDLSDPEAYPVGVSDALRDLTKRVDARSDQSS